jgi:hypothetical protein
MIRGVLAALAVVTLLLTSAIVLADVAIPARTGAGTASETGGHASEPAFARTAGAAGREDGPASPAAAGGTKYPVEFTETGLTGSTPWQVWLNSTDGGSKGRLNGTAHTFVFMVVNDTYAFQVGYLPGYVLNPANASGNVTVAGAGSNFTIPFVALDYRVRVSETGLPAGITWQATVDGTTKHTTSTSISYELPNGTYTWSIAAVSGYTVSPQTGHVTVGGGNRTVAVVFTPAPSGSFLSKWWWAILAVVVVLVIAVILLVRRERSRRPPAPWIEPGSAAVPPPSPPSPPPSGGPGPGPTSEREPSVEP